MMRKLRQSTAIIMWIVILAFVGLIVVEWGADYSGTKSSRVTDTIGSINGEEVSLRAFQQSLRNAARQRREEGRDQGQLVREVWDAMVSETLVRQQVKRLGIEISDEEVAYFTRLAPPPAVQALPAFQNEDGEFDPALYQQFISDRNTYQEESNRAFVLQVESMLRGQLRNQRLQSLLLETVRVTPQEVRQYYADRNEKVTVDYAYVAASTVPEEEVTLTEAEVQAQYEKMASEFHHPEQIRIWFVLFPRVASADDSAAVEREIGQLRKEIVEDGADFAEMAAAMSEDEASAANGGDLGTFGHGSMLPEFEEAAFALQPGEVSEPVRTARGWHLIKVEERIAGDSTGTGEQVHARHILLAYSPSTRTEDDLLERAEALHGLAAERGLRPAAPIEGQQARDAGWVARGGGLPGLGRGTQWIVARLFDSEVGTLAPVGSTDAGYFVAELAGRRPEGVVPLEEVREQVEWSVRSRKRSEIAGQQLREIRQAVEAGQSFEAAVAAAGLEVRTAGPFSRTDFVPGAGRGSPFAAAAFSLEPGRASDVVVQNNGAYLLRLRSRTPVDEEAFAQERASVEAEVLNARRSEALQVWFAQIYDSADIQDNRHFFYSF